MRLEDLVKPYNTLTSDEKVRLILGIRTSRRTPKIPIKTKKASSTAKKKANTAKVNKAMRATPKAFIQSLTPEEKERLKRELLGL